MRIASLLLVLPLILDIQAQDKINLMNGQVVDRKVLGQSTLEHPLPSAQEGPVDFSRRTHRRRVQRY
ncbi:MAG: hypothetical protein IPP33_05825 [Flavobacteriales bacterium]|nr:hypothetical protein [Flavobacteriales bacterium]